VKGFFKKTASVYSNDPEKPTLSIEIKGTVKQWITIEPSDKVQLDGFEGEEIKKVLTIKSRDEMPFKIEKIDSNLGEKVKTNLKAIKENSVYELEIIKPSTINENIVGTLTLFTSLEKKQTVNIDVKGTVRSEVKITPTLINFGNIDTSKIELLENLLKRMVILERVKGEGLLIKGIKFSSEIFKSQVETIQEGKRYKLTIILEKQNLKKGKFDEEMIVDTNYEKSPILKVKLTGNIL
jgi:molybdopterin-binding protein